MDDLSQDWFLEIIAEIYDAVFDMNRLTRLLEKIMHGLASESVLFRLQNQTDRSVGFNIYHGYDPTWRIAYQEYFRHLDPFPEAMRPAHTRMAIAEFYLPKDHLMRTEYYNDFMRPQGKLHCLGGYVFKSNKNFIQLGFQRGPKGEPYQESDLRALNVLVPHLQRMVTLNIQFAEMSQHNQVADFLSRSTSYGIAIFEENFQLVFTNQAAEEILGGDFGLKLIPQGITAPIPAESRQLQKLIRQGLQLAATGMGRMTPNGLRLTPIRPEQSPINVVVLPLRPEGGDSSYSPKRPRVMVILSTPDRAQPVVATAILKNLFGLTDAESHLARELAAGQDLDEIAGIKGISRHTARNQLKAVFAKTGTNRQAELVRLLATLPGGA